MSAEVASECRLEEGDQNKPRSPDEEEEQEHEQEHERAPKVEPKHPKVESKPPKQAAMDATNHKENDQSVASNSAETGRKKVTEAPPPKVNPWTKNNNNNNNPPCPPNNPTNNTQDSGMFSFAPLLSLIAGNRVGVYLHRVSSDRLSHCFGKPPAETAASTLASVLLLLLL